MISYRWSGVHVSLVCLLWLGLHLAPAQTRAPAGPAPGPEKQGAGPAGPAPSVGAAPGLEGPVRPETVAARKTTAQTRLEALAQLLLSQEEAEALRTTLEQHVRVLGALEAAFHKRAAYVAQLDSLPQQIPKLNAERRTLAARPPRRFAAVDEQLRLEYETQLQAVRTELDGLRKELTAGELRLAGIARDIEQRVTGLAQSERDLLTARNEAARATEFKALLLARAELLDLRHQLHQAELDMLEAEREWLTKQGPLRDAQLGLAQTRYAVLQQDLETIKGALGKAISQESLALASSEEDLARQLQQSTDPSEIMMLTVQLETIKLRQVTAEYRQQFNALGDQVSAQEQRNAQEKQEAEHLASLVEKYVSGARIAQRLQAAFTRLRREQARHGDASMQAMEVDLHVLTDQELDLEERLYDFDRHAEARLRDVAAALQTLTPAQREARLARVRQAAEAQKTALREQKQALRALVQEQTRLITQGREYRRLLQEGEQFIHARLFWLRDGQALSQRVFEEAASGAVVTARGVPAAVLAELALLPPGQDGAVRFWLLVGVLGLGLPWVGLQVQARLRTLAASFLAGRSESIVGWHNGVGPLLVLQSAIWPAYIILVAWAWPRVIMAGMSVIDLELPVLASLQLSAVVLWGWLLGRTLVRSEGWQPRTTAGDLEAAPAPPLPNAVGRALQRTLTAGCAATLVLLVPRYLVLHAVGSPEVVSGSQALARLCFTAFQVVLLVLLAIMGRRGSQLMTALLARSRQAHGLLWRHWPLLYLVAMGIMSTALALDVSGYHYAARTLWLRLGQALLVIVVLVGLDHKISTLLDRLTLPRQPFDGPAPTPLPHSLQALLTRGRPFMRLGLVLMGLLVIEHFYGIRQGLFDVLGTVHLFEVGRTNEGQTLWLTLRDVLEALVIITGTTVLVRHLPGICEAVLFPHLPWDAGVRYAFLTLSRYGLLFLAVWWSLSAVHLNWSSIQWIIAAVSVGVGFGLQEIVSNFVSGLILLLERPIRVDDIVTVGDQTGTVKRITIRATAIQNVDNQTVIIPNKEFIASRVTNWTLGDTYVRLVLPVGVAYGSDLELVKRLLTATVNSHPRVLTTPPPSVLLRAFGDSALQWEIWCFVPRPQDRLATANDLLFQIEQVFRQHDIAIPFPQQDIHLRSADAALVIQPPSNGYATLADHPGQPTSSMP